MLIKEKIGVAAVLAIGTALAVTAAVPAGMIQVYSGAYVDVPEATFFAFDRRSIPFRRNLRPTARPIRSTRVGRPDSRATGGDVPQHTGLPMPSGFREAYSSPSTPTGPSTGAASRRSTGWMPPATR